MARRIIGLDLGAYSVKLLRLETGKQSAKYEIITIAEEILLPEEEDGPSLLDRQKEALLKLHNAGILEAEACATGIYSGDGQIRSMAVPFVEPRKIEAILPGILESEVPFDISDMVMPWHRQGNASSGDKDGATSELNQIRLGFGKKSSIAATLQLLQNINVDPRILHLSSAAPYEIIREFGITAFLPEDEQCDDTINYCGAFVDFGHRATNLCVFDRNGIVSAHSFYRGGRKLTEEIAKKLEISFAEAELLKHEKLNFSHLDDGIGNQLREIATAHYQEILSQIQRIFIAHQSSGLGVVKTVAFVGGGAKTPGLDTLFKPLGNANIAIIRLSSFFPSQVDPNSMFLALAYALSILNLHSKDSRFNFRKDEFVWRGELDFLRTKSVPLVLWGLTIICMLTILWSAQSLVLEKENKSLEEQLKTTCASIIGKPNIPSKKCLALMKEQIASHVDMGIPEFSASDVYLKLAESLPSGLNIIIQELDIIEKRVKIAAQSPTYEDIDKVTALLRKIPCFIKLETGRTEKTDKGVKYNLSFDLDCTTNVAAKAG